MQIINIDKQSLPYLTTIRIEGVSYTFTFSYNLRGDFFTANLARGNEVLAVGEPMTYGFPLFAPSYDYRYPPVILVPADPTGKSTRVGWAELGVSVFLYLIPLDEEEEIEG